MAIEIREQVEVQVPVEKVWPFIMDPHKVVTCMPGAQLDEVVDASTFLGTVKIKVGAITTSYKGRVQFTQVDEQTHTVQMVADGRETGGGMAKGTISTRLQALPGGKTEMVVEANVDLTGRIMQVGRGMIQGVAHQLFLQFIARVKEQLEPAEGQPAAASTGAGQPASTPSPAPAGEPPPLRILPIVFKVIWSAISNFFRRLFGGPAPPA
ncbi:MAG: carbon monoxide dehydrogenase subunit [Deltaproteobacteria bacterium]|nr:carbon monoxide dehydrogenase subunit [Deltaproteobacteria bacterium]